MFLKQKSCESDNFGVTKSDHIGVVKIDHFWVPESDHFWTPFLATFMSVFWQRPGVKWILLKLHFFKCIKKTYDIVS